MTELTRSERDETHSIQKTVLPYQSPFNLDPGLQNGVKRDFTTCRQVLKAIYGMPQGPKLFQTNKFYPIIKAFDLKPIPDEPSIFVSERKELILIIWTDDLHLFFKKIFETLAKRLWAYLQEHMDLDDWCNLRYSLGIAVHRQRALRKMFLHQRLKIDKLLEDVQMTDCDPHPIPGTPNCKLTKEDLKDERQGKSPQARKYRKVVCTANHIAIWTRPDITTAVSKLSRYLRSPGDKHMDEMALLTRYLKSTNSHALCFDCSQVSTRGLVAYFDASFADCVDTRRSTVGYVIYLDGCPVSWKSRLHQRVATSSNNSEYSASAEAGKEILYLRKILTALGEETPTTPVFTDSNGCMALVETLGTTAKNKHVEIDCHFFKEMVQLKEAAVFKVSTANNDADIMTKILHVPKDPHQRHTRKMVRLLPLDNNATPTDRKDSQKRPPVTSVAATATKANIELLRKTHEALGHRNFQDVANIMGIPLPAAKLFCKWCVENKSTRHPMGNGDPGTMQAPRPGHTIDSDVAGRFPFKTKGGNQYASILVCRKSKKIDGKMVASPSEFFEHFSTFAKQTNADFGKDNVISILHSDSATYYKDSARLRQFCKAKGIRQTFSPPYTQALNSIAERCIRTIIEMARTSLLASGLYVVYYGEAIMYAIVVLNNLPKKKNGGWTPEELWQGRKHSYPIYTKLKPFGCAAWVLNLRQDRGKFDQKSELHVCLNYNPDSHAYRLLSIPQGRIFESAHVVFNVDYFPMKEKNMNDRAPQYSSIDLQDFDSPARKNERPIRDRTPSAQALRNLAAK